VNFGELRGQVPDDAHIVRLVFPRPLFLGRLWRAVMGASATSRILPLARVLETHLHQDRVGKQGGPQPESGDPRVGGDEFAEPELRQVGVDVHFLNRHHRHQRHGSGFHPGPGDIRAFRHPGQGPIGNTADVLLRLGRVGPRHRAGRRTQPDHLMLTGFETAGLDLCQSAPAVASGRVDLLEMATQQRCLRRVDLDVSPRLVLDHRFFLRQSRAPESAGQQRRVVTEEVPRRVICVVRGRIGCGIPHRSFLAVRISRSVISGLRQVLRQFNASTGQVDADMVSLRIFLGAANRIQTGRHLNQTILLDSRTDRRPVDVHRNQNSVGPHQRARLQFELIDAQRLADTTNLFQHGGLGRRVRESANQFHSGTQAVRFSPG